MKIIKTNHGQLILSVITFPLTMKMILITSPKELRTADAHVWRTGLADAAGL